jgi:hypothetical protein
MQAGKGQSVAAVGDARRSWALPSVEGHGLTAFKVAWLLALLLAVIAVPVGNYRDFVRGSERPFGGLGLGWSVEADGRIRLLVLSSSARAAGIRDGDTIIAVDNIPVSSEMQRVSDIEQRLNGPEGKIVHLSIRSTDGRLADVRLTRSRRHIDETYAGSGLTPELDRWMKKLADLLPSLVVMAAAVLLLRGRRTDPVPALLSLALMVQAASNFGTWSFYDSQWLLMLNQVLSSVAATGIVVGLLAFPHGRFEPRWTFWAAALTLGWGIVYCFLGGAWTDIIWATLLIAAIIALWQRCRELHEGLERQQIRWVLLGFAWGVGLLLLSAACYEAESVVGSLPLGAQFLIFLVGDWLRALGFCAMAGGVLVALLRFRLYDVDKVISRSAGYALLTVGFVGVFAASEKTLELFGERYFSASIGGLSAGLAAAVAAVAVAPLHNRMQNWAERRFQKGLQHLRRDLPACMDDLRETATVSEIMAEVLAQITAGVRASHAAAVVGDRVEAVCGVERPEVMSWLARAPLPPSEISVTDHSDALFPMRLQLRAGLAGGDPLGWLLLGPRPDGSLYSGDEEEALAEVIPPVARAVQVVRKRQEREDALRSEVQRRLDALEEAVARLASRDAAPAGHS